MIPEWVHLDPQSKRPNFEWKTFDEFRYIDQGKGLRHWIKFIRCIHVTNLFKVNHYDIRLKLFYVYIVVQSKQLIQCYLIYIPMPFKVNDLSSNQ